METINRFYLAQLLKEYQCLFIFLQEHWLPYHESEKRLKTDFLSYNFHTTSSNMFLPTEDLLLQRGPTWHGTAIGWHSSVNTNIKKIPVVSDRFCGVVYHNATTRILAFTAYMPTSGQEEEFLEIISQLTLNLLANIEDRKTCSIIIGLDSNQSKKSTSRRTNSMKCFISDFLLKTILLDDKQTFHHNNQTSESQIDTILFFIPNSEINLKFSDHLCKNDNPDNLSTHDVIIGDISIPHNPSVINESDFSSTYTEFQVKKPKWE